MRTSATYRCYRCREIKGVDQFYPSRSHQSRPVTANCKPCSSKSTAAWNKKNPRSMAAWYERNPDYQADWRAKNPEKVRLACSINNRKRRARKAGAQIIERIDLDTLYARDNGVCGICNMIVLRSQASHDHIIPLAVGGDHSWANAQLAHITCNSSKKATTTIHVQGSGVLSPAP